MAVEMGEPASKRRKLSQDTSNTATTLDEDAHSTDFKLAILASLHPDRSQDVLLDYLLAYDGSVEAVTSALNAPAQSDHVRKRTAISYQSSLTSFTKRPTMSSGNGVASKALTKKGRTLHLYVWQPEAHRRWALMLSVTVARRR